MAEGSGKTALVTGASSGIGKAFAELLAQKGYAVVVTARRADRLDALAAELKQKYGVATHTIVADLSQPDASQQIAGELASRQLAIDVLVNNAGYGVPGSYVNVPWIEHERLSTRSSRTTRFPMPLRLVSESSAMSGSWATRFANCK